MASPAAADLPASDTAALKADPVAIRACLSLRLVAEFDAEWESVLEQARASKDLAGGSACPARTVARMTIWIPDTSTKQEDQ